MNDGDVLRKAILNDPFDRFARVAYADWLEEKGDVELAAGVRCPVSPTVLTFGEVVLLGDFLEAAFARRDLIDELVIAQSRFLQLADLLFSRHPIVKVTLSDTRPLKPPAADIFVWRRHPGRYSGSGPPGAFSVIQPPLWRFLSRRSRALLFMYASEERALEDLSDACVRYGREKAGLTEKTH